MVKYVAAKKTCLQFQKRNLSIFVSVQTSWSFDSITKFESYNSLSLWFYLQNAVVRVSQKGYLTGQSSDRNLAIHRLRQKKSRKSWARILKHLMEAEKSTLRGELSFQRLKCTAGLKFFVFCFENCFVETVWKKIKYNESTFAFFIENICRLIRKSWNHTFSPTFIWKSLRIRALVF